VAYCWVLETRLDITQRQVLEEATENNAAAGSSDDEVEIRQHTVACHGTCAGIKIGERHDLDQRPETAAIE
jgi:hypothetical protein